MERCFLTKPPWSSSLSPFCRYKDWSSERLRNLSEDTQPVSVRVGILTQDCGTPTSCVRNHSTRRPAWKLGVSATSRSSRAANESREWAKYVLFALPPSSSLHAPAYFLWLSTQYSHVTFWLGEEESSAPTEYIREVGLYFKMIFYL